MGQLARGSTQATWVTSIALLDNKSPRKSCRLNTKVFDTKERSSMEVVISEYSSLIFFAFSVSPEGLVMIPILVITLLQTLRI